MQYLKLLNGDAMQLSSQILDTMHYLQQPVSHRHHVQPAHQPTQSLHHGTSAPFSNHSGGSNTLLGQRLRNVTHRSNAAAVHVPGGTVAHATSDAFQPSLCKKRIIVSHCRYCYYQQYYCCRVALLLLLLLLLQNLYSTQIQASSSQKNWRIARWGTWLAGVGKEVSFETAFERANGW